MDKDLDLSYVNEKGKLVHGTAAYLHFVYTVMGGIQNYHKELHLKATSDSEFVKEYSDFVAQKSMKKIHCSRLKLLDKE